MAHFSVFSDRALRGAVMAFALILISAACSSSGGSGRRSDASSGDTSVDAADGEDGFDGSDLTDAVDGADLTDASDVTDALDVTDGLDITDASDVTDALDVTDASDVTDGSDTTDATDGMDGADATDGMDGTDATDGMDMTDASDVTDGSTDGGIIYGGVLVAQIEDPNLQLGAVTASFTYIPDAQPNVVAADGACVAYTPLPAGSPQPGASIGTITLTGLSQPVTMTPQPVPGGVIYDSGLPENQPSILSTVPTIDVSAAGSADLGPVAVQLSVPPSVVVTSPADDVKQNQPLTVNWVGINATKVRVDLAIYDSEGEQKSGNIVTCELEGDPGTVTVSPALMAQLPVSGSGPFNVNVLVVGVTRIESQMVDVSGNAGAGTVEFAVARSAGTGVVIE